MITDQRNQTINLQPTFGFLYHNNHQGHFKRKRNKNVREKEEQLVSKYEQLIDKVVKQVQNMIKDQLNKVINLQAVMISVIIKLSQLEILKTELFSPTRLVVRVGMRLYILNDNARVVLDFIYKYAIYLTHTSYFQYYVLPSIYNSDDAYNFSPCPCMSLNKKT